MSRGNYIRDIQKLKQTKNILILAHYYVDGAVQEIADFVGDSYYLSQKALEAKEEKILFCGVNFMAESAKLLSPSKMIIMPEPDADCPMVHMVTPYEIHKVRKQYEDLAVVSYINSTAQIKSLSDVCVTSSNAIKVVSQLKERNIFFIPDQNLGRFIASQIPGKNFVFNDGFCCVHNDISKDDLKKLSESVPNAKILAHPECQFEILQMADFVGSTSNMINYVSQSNHKDFIIGTEIGILHELEKNNPNKRFYIVNNKQVCNNMKKITLEKVYHALATLSPTVELQDSISIEARKPLEKMHALAK